MAKHCKPRNPPVRVGNEYGRWTVLSKDPLPEGKKSHHQKFTCRCSCGLVRSIFSSSLRTGGSLSCGCRKAEVISKRCRLPNRQGVVNRLYLRLTVGAAKRNLPVSIDREVFAGLIVRDCAYCGDPPNQSQANIWVVDDGDPMLLYHGLDRVDNGLGYHIDNVVTCCSKCNFMKNKFSYEDFKAHVEKIHRHTLASL